MVALRAQASQTQGTTTKAYQQCAVRREGVTQRMAGFRRNPIVNLLGRADLLRQTALFVVAVLLSISTASSLRLVCLAARPVAAMWVFR